MALFSVFLALLWVGVGRDLGASSGWFWSYSVILLATLVWMFVTGYRVGRREPAGAEPAARPRSTSLTVLSVLVPAAAVLVSALIASQGARGRVVFGVVASLFVALLLGGAAGVMTGRSRAGS